MCDKMQQYAIDTACTSFRKYSIDRDIAEYIKN